MWVLFLYFYFVFCWITIPLTLIGLYIILEFILRLFGKSFDDKPISDSIEEMFDEDDEI